MVKDKEMELVEKIKDVEKTTYVNKPKDKWEPKYFLEEVREENKADTAIKKEIIDYGENPHYRILKDGTSPLFYILNPDGSLLMTDGISFTSSENACIGIIEQINKVGDEFSKEYSEDNTEILYINQPLENNG